MDEIWKDIPDYEERYQASSEGRIRSVDREVRHWQGGVSVIKGKVIKPTMSRKGYLRVQLHKEGKMKCFRVHRLVWMAFNGEIPDGYEVNHIDEDKTNNRLINLNIMTHKQNVNFGTRNQRAAKALSKPVVAFDKTGNVVLEFTSIIEGQRNGYDSGSLCNCCKGKLKHHRGLRWKYKENA